MQIIDKPNLFKIEFPAVILDVSSPPKFKNTIIDIDKYKIPITTNILESFKLNLIDLPPTIVVFNSLIELILYAANHRLTKWLVDNFYNFYKLPFQKVILIQTFLIKRIVNNFIECEDAPYLLITPYHNVDNYNYATVVLIDNFYICIGYSEHPIMKKLIKL